MATTRTSESRPSALTLRTNNAPSPLQSQQTQEADLDAKGKRLERYLATYGDIPGLEILVTSARTGQGVEELAERLRGRLSVLYGPSGAGKSSLLDEVDPDGAYDPDDAPVDPIGPVG